MVDVIEIRKAIESNLPEGWILEQGPDSEMFWPRILGGRFCGIKDVLITHEGWIGAITIKENESLQDIAQHTLDTVEKIKTFRSNHPSRLQCDDDKCDCRRTLKPTLSQTAV